MYDYLAYVRSRRLLEKRAAAADLAARIGAGAARLMSKVPRQIRAIPGAARYVAKTPFYAAGIAGNVAVGGAAHSARRAGRGVAAIIRKNPGKAALLGGLGFANYAGIPGAGVISDFALYPVLEPLKQVGSVVRPYGKQAEEYGRMLPERYRAAMRAEVSAGNPLMLPRSAGMYGPVPPPVDPAAQAAGTANTITK